MKQVIRLHRESMSLADKAIFVRSAGHIDEATDLTRQAFNKEREAAELVAENLDLEPTRSVLFRSAASLALECGELREAERLISMALSGCPPEEIAEELRDLLEDVLDKKAVRVSRDTSKSVIPANAGIQRSLPNRGVAV